jgi:hypothetical protein
MVTMTNEGKGEEKGDEVRRWEARKYEMRNGFLPLVLSVTPPSPSGLKTYGAVSIGTETIMSIDTRGRA